MKLSEEELELFEIAYCLHKTMSEMMEMDYDELLGWINYLDRRPVGWREDNRTSLLLMSAGAKVKPSDIFPSLKKLSEGAVEISDQERMSRTLKGSALFSKLQTATGGDKLDL